MSHTINAAFYNLPVDVVAAMAADMDAAAKEFWAYPGEAWQYAFEEEWLYERGYVEAAAKAADCIREVAG